MLNSFFKIAWRNLIRNKLFSAINILGLAIGMICAIFILLWIQHERSYDTHNKNAKRIYRITREFLNPDGSTNIHLAAIAPPLAPLIRTDFPEIKEVTRFIEDDRAVFRYQQNSFTETGIIWADDNFFKVFDISFLSGDPQTALKAPYALVLTETAAKKYFGNADPLNQNILYGEKEIPMKITGVIKNVPNNSHFQFDMVVSFASLKNFFPPDMETSWWGFNSFYTYVLLPENYSAKQLESKFPAFLDKHLQKNDAGLNPSQYNKLHLQALTDIHLKSHLNGEFEPGGNTTYVYLFLAIAFFIILIACFNFINLSTARSTSRAKEVGIRKTIGAAKFQLVWQFLSESMLIALIALVIAIAGVKLLIPYFEDFTGKSFGVILQHYGWVIFAIIALVLIIGILSGLYPAFYLSSFKPAKVIKGSGGRAGGQMTFRKILVVSQFSITAILIVAVLVVLKQLNYVQQKNLGFNKDHVVILPLNDSLQQHFTSVKNILQQDPHIISTSLASRIPSGKLLDAQDWSVEINGEIKKMGFRLSYSRVDFDFFKTFQVPMAAGRDFSTSFATDSSDAYIINETAVKTIGWKTPMEAINKQLVYGDRKGKVIGVVKDFNFESLHNPITPVIFMIPNKDKYAYRNFIVRIDPKSIGASIDLLRNTWKEFAPKMEFEYQFLDETFARLYQSEQKLAVLFEWFAGIAIFIACLGLLGLSSFSTEQRTKEIGIRKVLGATTSGIVSLLSADFLKLVLLANIIAWPLAYYGMHRWLQEFAYHTSINWWIFLTTGIIALLIAFLTVSVQAIRAAIANPTKSLRTE